MNMKIVIDNNLTYFYSYFCFLFLFYFYFVLFLFRERYMVDLVCPFRDVFYFYFSYC